VIATTSAGCDAATSARGIVFDEEQKPIASSSVRLVRLETGEVDEHQTDVNGHFVVTIIHGLLPGRFTLTVSKQGYATFSQEIQPKIHHVLKVVLARTKEVNQDKPR
jgi:hypothetical protein